MNRKQVIETLKMENDLICFNPLTGEDIPLECVNELNKKCYDAHQEAIRLINNSIDIEWLHSIMKKQLIFAMESEMEGTTTVKDGVIHCISGALACQVLANVIELWEKENEESN